MISRALGVLIELKAYFPFVQSSNLNLGCSFLGLCSNTKSNPWRFFGGIFTSIYTKRLVAVCNRSVSRTKFGYAGERLLQSVHFPIRGNVMFEPILFLMLSFQENNDASPYVLSLYIICEGLTLYRFIHNYLKPKKLQPNFLNSSQWRTKRTP